jgi:hypothetical protein
MAIQKENVSIDVQDIIELLHSGYTWFKKDDLGYGSIQEKFNALDIHIKTIQKHPELANVDTIAKVFVITNRNKTDNGSTTTNDISVKRDEINLGGLPKTDERSTRSTDTSILSQVNNGTLGTSTTESSQKNDLSAFANL